MENRSEELKRWRFACQVVKSCPRQFRFTRPQIQNPSEEARPHHRNLRNKIPTRGFDFSSWSIGESSSSSAYYPETYSGSHFAPNSDVELLPISRSENLCEEEHLRIRCFRVVPPITQGRIDEGLPQIYHSPFDSSSITLPGMDDYEASTSRTAATEQPRNLRTLSMRQFQAQQHTPCPLCKSTHTWINYHSSHRLSWSHYFCESCQNQWTSGGFPLTLQMREFQTQQHSPCLRCQSIHTWISCHSSHYLSQSRHFCGFCQIYWTRGGSLRNSSPFYFSHPNQEFPNPTIPVLAMSDQGVTIPLQYRDGGQLINTSTELPNEVHIELRSPWGDISRTELEILSREMEDQGRSRMLMNLLGLDPWEKVAGIILGITGQAAFNIYSTNQSSTSVQHHNSNWLDLYLVPATIAVGFISSLTAIILGPKKRRAAGFVYKIGAIAAISGTILAVGSCLPERLKWITSLVSLIPCIGVPLA